MTILTRQEFIDQRTKDMIENHQEPFTVKSFKQDIAMTAHLTGIPIEIDVEDEFNKIWDAEYELYLNEGADA